MRTLTEQEFYDLFRHTAEIPHDRFNELFRHATEELISIYGEKNVTEEQSGATRALRGEYLAAIGSELLFFIRGDREDHERFLTRSRAAFLKIWRERARKNIKGAEYGTDDTER